MAILHRKNSLSFKTLHGARIGDVHMSLIHTCELNRVNRLIISWPSRPRRRRAESPAELAALEL